VDAWPERPRHAVARSALLDRLTDQDARVVVITAPAGYGKTILLRHLAERVSQAAYVLLGPTDNDPSFLLGHVAAAMAAAHPIHAEALERYQSGDSEPGLKGVVRLSEAAREWRDPGMLMFDEMENLTDRRARDALTLLAEQPPPGMRLVLAGRSATSLSLSRLLAAGQVIEIGGDDLAFDVDQTAEMARSLGIDLDAARISELVAETDGWPVALYLKMLTSRDGSGRERHRSAHETSRPLADYIHTQLIEPLGDQDRSWLLRSSVLDELSGPLCDAALETTGSLARLRALAGSHLLIDALDEKHTVYRCHPLLRDELRDELEVQMPGEAPQVAARAARWLEERGQIEAAVEYARRSGDREHVATLMARHLWPIHWSGRIATMERWISWFDEDGLRERYASVAVLAGFMYAIDGRRHEAELWLAAAEHSSDDGPMPDGTADRAAWVSMLRGMMAPAGLAAVKADLAIALEGMRPDSPFMPGVRLLAAVASIMEGRPDAEVLAREARELSEARGALPGFAISIAEEAALVLRSGRDRQAWDLVRYGLEKVRAAGLEGYVLCGLLHAVSARAALAMASTADANHHIAQVNRLRPRLNAVVPWFAVQIRLETMRAHLAMDDVASARMLRVEVDDILRVRPDLGTLTTEVASIRAQIEASREGGAGRWTLTSAELAVLAYLPTHLTFTDIAERLFISRHTVKSHAVSIYGKLGVSSRRDAVETAVGRGLLDPSAVRFPPAVVG